ncbi:MAG: TolC family protein [Ferruginibacter sp.]
MMKTKALVILCIFSILTLSKLYAQNAPTTYNLQTSINIALANNIPVKQAALQEEADKLTLNQAKYNRLPNVAANVNYGINNGRSIDPFTNSYNNQQLSTSNANLTASVPVFKGLELKNSIQQAFLTQQASAMELQQEKDNLTLNVILAFLQLMNDEDVLALTRNQILVTQKQAERLEKLNNEGAISPSLLYDMRGQYATDQLAVITAAKSLENSKLSLAQYMNIPYKKEIGVDRAGFDMTIALYEGTADKIYATAIEKLALVKAADLRTRAATKAIRVASAGFYPTLSLIGQLGSNYSSAASTKTIASVNDVASGDYVFVNNTTYQVITKDVKLNSHKINYFTQYNNNLNTFFGLNLQVPIFSSFQTRTNVRLARVEEKRVSYIAENTKIQLRQAIEQAHLNMTTAYEKYNITAEQVKAFEESFHAAEIKFNLGAINSVEYLIVKNNLDRATQNLTIARYEYLLRTKVLDFYQGSLK